SRTPSEPAVRVCYPLPDLLIHPQKVNVEPKMRTLLRGFGLILLSAAFAGALSAGEISGTVKGPDGSAFKGAFVHAQNSKTKITVDVLSDRNGAYRVENLDPGDYVVTAAAEGYKSDPRRGVKVDADLPVSLDFALQKGMVRWADLSIHEGQVLLHDGPGKQLLFYRCMSCHGLQTKIAAARRDEDGWSECVALMRNRVGGVGDLRITDADGAAIAKYLGTVFSVDSNLAHSPADLPEYSKVKHAEFSDEAMKIVYVLYDLPQIGRIPWVAYPQSDGAVWMPHSWTADQIAKLDQKTGEVQEYNVPQDVRRAVHVHSVLQAPDGMVWFSEDAACNLGKFDPETKKITMYKPPFCRPKPDDAQTGRGMHSIGLGSMNSIRLDPYGYLWGGGSMLLRFDPRKEEFMEFPEARTPYGIELDKQGNIWFAEFPKEGMIGKMDTKTLKITKWTPPTTLRLAALNKGKPDSDYGNSNPYPKTAGPRRITVDSQGIVWFGEWWGNQIGRFDPKTETFKEYALPDPDPTPYAIGVDHYGYVWYSSYDDDILGRLDPKTGSVVEFPLPFSGNGMRELMPDSQGHMWFGTPFNNKVGYFIPPEPSKMAQR
ncbi:MAG: virginiamycin B lyase family protein, partial [Candidatus Acidiferrales bacterium]